MGTEPAAAAWLLAGALPVSLWVAWSDLARMTIPNRAVLALVAVFATVGLAVLPLPDWGWRWSHLGVMLLAGMALNAAGAMGAGDAKFIAAAAPFVALSDAAFLIALLAGCLIVAFVLHRIARATALRRLAPHWKSWEAGKRFPMGLPLAAALCLYLARAATAG